jgi:hypothetical protein
MGTGMGRRMGSTLCEAQDVYGRRCNTSVKYEATWISTGTTIRLCANHEDEFRRKGLIQESTRVRLSDIT